MLGGGSPDKMGDLTSKKLDILQICCFFFNVFFLKNDVRVWIWSRNSRF